MDRIEQVAERVGVILAADSRLEAGKCIIQKKRTITLYTADSHYTHTLDFAISFKNFQADGTALNKAQIYLLPEEFPYFVDTLRKYPCPLPPHHKLRVRQGWNMICFTVKTKEAPDHFAQRLSAALKVVEQSENMERLFNQNDHKRKRGARNVGQI